MITRSDNGCNVHIGQENCDLLASRRKRLSLLLLGLQQVYNNTQAQRAINTPFCLFETCQKRTGIILAPGNAMLTHFRLSITLQMFQDVCCSAARPKFVLNLTCRPARPVGLCDAFHCSPFFNIFSCLFIVFLFERSPGVFAQVPSLRNLGWCFEKNSKCIGSGSQGRNV